MFYVCFGLWRTPYIRGVKQISDGSDAGQPDFMLFKLQNNICRVYYVRHSGAYFLTVFHISLFDKNVCFLCILEFKIFWGWRKSSWVSQMMLLPRQRINPYVTFIMWQKYLVIQYMRHEFDYSFYFLQMLTCFVFYPTIVKERNLDPFIVFALEKEICKAGYWRIEFTFQLSQSVSTDTLLVFLKKSQCY